MNKIINSRLILIFSVVAFLTTSCNMSSKNSASIKGIFTGDLKDRIIHLSKVENGITVKIAESPLTDKGHFSFNEAIDKAGIYVINTFNKKLNKNERKDHDLKRFYLENGTSISIEMNEDSYILKDCNSEKNRVLSKWNNIADTLYMYGLGFDYFIKSYDDFFPVLPKYISISDNFKKNINIEDTEFNKLMSIIIDVDLIYSSVMLTRTPRMKHPTKKEYPEFYTKMHKNNHTDTERLLELPNGVNYLTNYILFTIDKLDEDKKPTNLSEFTKLFISMIPADVLKGHFALEYSKNFKKKNLGYLKWKKSLEPYILNDYLKEGFKSVEANMVNS